jgi:hypothetical protein
MKKYSGEAAGFVHSYSRIKGSVVSALAAEVEYQIALQLRTAPKAVVAEVCNKKNVSAG